MGALPLVELMMTVLGALLWWQLMRQVGRIDKLEASIHELALGLARHHYSKDEVEQAVERAVRPMRDQLNRIERLASGHPASPTHGFTGRYAAVKTTPVDASDDS